MFKSILLEHCPLTPVSWLLISRPLCMLRCMRTSCSVPCTQAGSGRGGLQTSVGRLPIWLWLKYLCFFLHTSSGLATHLCISDPITGGLPQARQMCREWPGTQSKVSSRARLEKRKTRADRSIHLPSSCQASGAWRELFILWHKNNTEMLQAWTHVSKSCQFYWDYLTSITYSNIVNSIKHKYRSVIHLSGPTIFWNFFSVQIE